MSLYNKFKTALTKTSDKLSLGINSLLGKKTFDQNTIDQFEELLISTDINYHLATKIISDLKELPVNSTEGLINIKQKLKNLILNEILPYQINFELKLDKTNIVLFCGVNGNGKTTSIGKLAAYMKNQGKKICIVACDTFRAGAVEQLELWAQRSQTTIFKGNMNELPATVAFKAVEQAKQLSYDTLLIDTAGRLQNYTNLMDELNKLIRTIEKANPTAELKNILVIDGTTGQNALNQVEEFKNIANISGIIITKLDGTSKAGIVISIMAKFKLPIYFVGIGETIEDLKPFNVEDFVDALLDL